MSEKLNFSIRLDAQLKTEVERVASLGGVSPSDVIRICVAKGLPILAEGYHLIHERFIALRSMPLGQPLVSSGAVSGVARVEADFLEQAADGLPESEPTPPIGASSGVISSRKPAVSKRANPQPAFPKPAPQ